MIVIGVNFMTFFKHFIDAVEKIDFLGNKFILDLFAGVQVTVLKKISNNSSQK